MSNNPVQDNDLLAKIKADLVVAMKARDEIKVSVLRMLDSAMKYYQIDAGDLSSQDQIKVLRKEAKKRLDAISLYQKANRDDQADQERQELGIIEAYLPDQMGRDELEQVVDRVIGQFASFTQKELGQVMAKVMTEVGGRANGAEVSAVVRSRLS
ncbi:GatB/YqeY domain-containing protein [Candidatus Saccharibacteria bacterium]|nr:GatB/YqeY domain-containing protein [Candidatus Saccharibacteria bacterium]MCB9834993.1 GatB/YqeY domain-containing protein [Candidatus Nomurabacteria bacterium]